MRKVRTFILLGIWMMVLPFLGFPASWKNILFSVSGVVLVCVSYLLYRDFTKEEKEEGFDNFSENTYWSEGEAERGEL